MQTTPSSHSGHPHESHSREGQFAAHNCFNLWLSPTSGPWCPPCPRLPPHAGHYHQPQARKQYLLEPSRMVEIHPLLAPSLPTCLEANLGKVSSWNFSLGGWDKILLTGEQLGNRAGPETG